MRELVYIGQQSWLVRYGSANILVDPVLGETFGSSENLRFRIVPSRSVDIQRMPRVDAVVLTNEHIGHLDFPSLNGLPQEVPVLVPSLTPTVAIDAIRATGRDVVLMNHDSPCEVGGAKVTMYYGRPDVPVWEARTMSCLISASEKGGIFFQSDTAVRPNQAQLCQPDVFVATHNAQIAPVDRLTMFDNMLPLPPATPAEMTGLHMLNSVVNTSSAMFDSVRWTVLSGKGYVQEPDRFGTYLWSDFEQLAETANLISLGTRVIGLRPGQSARFEQNCVVDRACVDWVRHIAPSADTSASAESVDDFGDVESPLFDVDPSSDDQAQIVHELEMMAPHLMLSPLGRSLITTNSYLDNPVGAARFVVHLRHFDAHSDAAFVLNLNTGTFERADMSLREAVFTVPAGVQFNAADLAAVLSGRLHIWELATSRARQWYLTDRLESPIAFLFGYLGEHTRADLLANLYATLSQQSL